MDTFRESLIINTHTYKPEPFLREGTHPRSPYGPSLCIPKGVTNQGLIGHKNHLLDVITEGLKSRTPFRSCKSLSYSFPLSQVDGVSLEKSNIYKRTYPSWCYGRREGTTYNNQCPSEYLHSRQHREESDINFMITQRNSFDLSILETCYS